MEAELDTRCPVCLENWDSAAYAMPCCHQFCFHCIQRWTSTRPQCPLCKQGVESIIHTVQVDNDYQELVLRPAPAASMATWSRAGPRAARLWSAVPRRSVGGLTPATWASLFREHPVLLRPLRYWLRHKLRRILGSQEPQANRVARSVMQALLLVGLEEETLRERLDPDLEGLTVTFVQQLIAFTVRRFSREAHRLLGLNVSPAAGPQEPRAAPREEAPVPCPAASSSPASSNRDEMPGRAEEELRGRPSRPHSNPATVTREQAAPRGEPEEPVAGPSGTSLPEGTRRAPKRKASDSQASASPKKRPPRR
ncbi:atherin-like [Numida meleagris]|uniref:atherin-like n=1 Tax=Numida meleagris TaxID=8996 RepID=UPI000B3DFD44|nr:atherin-like [Numida meleagris]